MSKYGGGKPGTMSKKEALRWLLDTETAIKTVQTLEHYFKEAKNPALQNTCKSTEILLKLIYDGVREFPMRDDPELDEYLKAHGVPHSENIMQNQKGNNK